MLIIINKFSTYFYEYKVNKKRKKYIISAKSEIPVVPISPPQSKIEIRAPPEEEQVIPVLFVQFNNKFNPRRMKVGRKY